MDNSDFRSRFLAFIKGRSNRKEYWLSCLFLIIGNFALAAVVNEPAFVSLVSLPFWLVIAGRRLHDFNARRVWALIPLGVGFLAGFIRGFANAAMGTPAMSQQIETVVSLVVTLVVFIVIGSIPGSRSANRYGLPVGGAASA